MDIHHLLTVADFCRAMGMSRSTWQKLKREGRTPRVITVGGIQRISREAAEDWLAENEARASADAAHQTAGGPEPLVA